ncbi:MAG TPA: sigma-70 family RNA polymerase sigma factor [Pyrinomonadaceae bacterium]|nr:sigma-70 family RNA polymerase sigma factor [Pyrinomonadaceae bacterium]
MALAQRSTVSLRIVDGGPRSLDLGELVPAVAAGNEAAVARLFAATNGLLFGLLLLILGDTATAEDVLVEVHVEVRQQARRFDKDHESLLIWLITIAHRRALEKLCSSTEDQQFVISVGLAPRQGSDLARPFRLSKSAHRKLVGATLDALSPLEQKMIELAYFSRMTPRAIAMTLRLPPDTVKTGLQYGISRLYSLFKNQGFLSVA